MGKVMKFLFLAYNEAVDDEVMEILSGSDVDNYTKWTKVLGKGGKSGPHLNSHVWPKSNNVIVVAVSESQASMVLDSIRRMREKLGHEGIKAFQLPLEDLT